MKKIISILFTTLLFGLSVFILEGAFFRLVDWYAKYRLSLAWGEAGKGGFNEYLKKLPMDHFKEPPSRLAGLEDPSYKALEEHQYASKIMSFSRPLRDKFKDETEETLDPLVNFEIRDFGPVRSIVLPGWQRSASPEEVRRKMARRVGDSLEFSRGLFIYLQEKKDDEDFSENFKRLEPTFGFLLNQGVACCLLPVSSSTDLLEKVRFLKTKYSQHAENLFVSGGQKCAPYLLEACSVDPDLFKAVMVRNSAVLPSPPSYRGLPWFLAEVETQNLSENETLSNVLQWVNLCRDADHLYASRLGGMLRLGDREESSTISSFSVAFMLESLNFLENVGDRWPTAEVLDAKPVERVTVSKPKPPTVSPETQDFDIVKIEESIREIEKRDPQSPSSRESMFDCEIVRGYRELHANDPELSLISNRDLVLKLGLGFEEMGSGVLDKVGERDPLFIRFYQSLRMVQSMDSPLN
tara:strand:- start:186 stop:1586 length:1401 start_codon:yes stop_codon:yes gene_type:complete